MQKPIYSPDDEQLLMAQLWSPVVKDDPEAFVLFAAITQNESFLLR